MQFITNGPDIPDVLIQAQEEGRLVFFCGAGISYPAGLPSFKDLVSTVYKLCETEPSEIEREAFERGLYDATLDLLEQRIPLQRIAVRRSIAQALKPQLRRKGAVDTHAALLRLARSRDGALRLVTTNFDRVFHVAARRTAQDFETYAAPMLPIPKNSRWNGLVFLHGLISEKPDDTSLNRLVATSGDFGLAYLTERWAARFVTELFRNYVVCFVGYSINDPVLRYMMDALAADRRMGESVPQAWAMGDCTPENEKQKIIEWKAKGVKPILYTVRPDSRDHSALHETLCAWADTYRDGVYGKEAIVVKHALALPQESTQQDDYVGRMLWAISDKSGLPAKRFADFNPAPSLEWLIDCFSTEVFGHWDLPRLGVPAKGEMDDSLRFSLIRRPAPYDLASPMHIAFVSDIGSAWDKVMFQIARWLARHLDDPRLVIWIVEQGGSLHAAWRQLIEREIERFSSLERDGKFEEIATVRSHSPNAVPGKLMRVLWGVLLGNRVKRRAQGLDFYRWKRAFRRDGLTTMLRLELRELLAPKVVINRPYRWNYDAREEKGEPSHIRQLVNYEVVLASDHVRSALHDLSDQSWTLSLPKLLGEFQRLLIDALDLLRELGDADDYRDRSHWDMPSIGPHWQNRGFHDWVSLIELLRDAWLAVLSTDKSHASRIAESWFDMPYPTFKRLAFFAASHEGCIKPENWVGWLAYDDAWWLWSYDTRREMLRLLVLQGKAISGVSKKLLEATILEGPPRKMFRDDIVNAQWSELVDREVWLRLAKLEKSGCMLGNDAGRRLTQLSKAYPDWRLAENERDEFSHWMSGTGDPDYESSVVTDVAPRRREDLVRWLVKSRPEERSFYEDTWRDVCRTRFFHSALALYDLSQDDKWPSTRWSQAFEVWAQEPMPARSWRWLARFIERIPDETLIDVVNSFSWWIESVSKVSMTNEHTLINLCRRIIDLEISEESSRRYHDGVEIYDPVSSAISHPVGHVTQALINTWFKRKPSDNDLLPEFLRPMLSGLANIEVARFRHGRVLLASQFVTLFRVDRAWTERFLVPLFDWSDSGEARAMWEGFLWSPRLYPPALNALKNGFLGCSKNYSCLGSHRQQYCAFLVYTALNSCDGFTDTDFRVAISSLPQEGLEECAQAVYQALEGAAGQREDYWKNRVQPFWRNIWPKSRDLASQRISEIFARLTIAAGGEFPAALSTVVGWLKPIPHAYNIVSLLDESGLCKRHPKDSLVLLAALIDDRHWFSEDFGSCLDSIVQASPKLSKDPRYKRLKEQFQYQRM